MSKKRARIRFVWLAIVVLIGLLLAVCPFDIPFTNSTYHGFAGSIQLGLDLSGGVAVVYDCTPAKNSNNSDITSAVDATKERLESVLFSEGFAEAKVVRENGNRIRIEVPNVSDPSEVLGALTRPKTLYMTLNEVKEPTPISAFADGEIVTGFQIDKVNVSMQNQDGKDTYGVSVQFTNEGGEAFKKLTEKASQGDKKIYVYLGNDEDGNITSAYSFGQVTCESTITGGSTFISGEDIDNLESAKEYAYSIMSGTFQVELSLIENSVISATLGKNALFYGIIAGVVALVIIMFIMWLRYGDFGLLADFALIVYMILMLFFLQAIPFIQLTLPGIAGIILSLGMAVDGNVIIFERIKEEYASGKKIPLAVKSGFKRAFWPIFDSNITTVITSIILYILGTASIKGFAITLLLGILLSMFTSLVVTRFFVKSYLPLNSTKPKKLRLYREKGVVEIQEEKVEEKEKAVPFDFTSTKGGE